jgi:hypothetical protein
MLLALVGAPRPKAVSRPRVSTKGRGGRSGSSGTKTRKSSRVGKFDRRAGRYGAYRPVEVPPIQRVAPLLRYGRTPYLLAALVVAGLLVWLFWPVANKPQTARPQAPDPLAGPVAGEVVFPEFRTGTITQTSYFKETFDPGTSQLGPRPPIEYTTTYTEEVAMRGLRYQGFYENEEVTDGQVSRQTGAFLNLDPTNPTGFGRWSQSSFLRTSGQPGTIGEGASTTRIQRTTWGGATVGGVPVPFPARVGGPGPLFPAPVPQPARRALPAVAPPAVAPPPAVPEAEPLPQQAPDTTGAPSFKPQRKPGGVGFKPEPVRTPVIPATAVPMQPDARPKPAPPLPAPATPPGTTFLPDGTQLPGNGPKPNLQSISNELGKIERKAELLLARPAGPDLGGIGDLTDLLQLLMELVGEPYEQGSFSLSSPCEKDSEGNPAEPRTVSWGAGAGRFNEVRSMLFAVMELLQHSKELRQPVCTGARAVGDPFTVIFEEVGGGGGGGTD